ncbi:ShlB/FhaC/HecB family hemolysin secretion/activation protein [Thorsellia anophelis]|uniref:ShlB/FhaC/HecB family hemolysin secretion/activation protein n=1 Tax=Thorsellia anophelis TaxID=336804 RepID=UPI001FDFD5E7|nr:ShlB/FhaC/HecB family hemolysin secretion/activation protein [Thorsellia anophelis]
MLSICSKSFVLFLCVFFVYSIDAVELNVNGNEIIKQQQIIQQQRQEARQAALAQELPSVRFDASTGIASSSDYPTEDICFVINQIVIEDKESLPQAIPLNFVKESAQGLCLGGIGISQLVSNLQNLIIDRGYVTTRIVAPEQDLTTGILTLKIIPGKVRQVYFEEGSAKYAFLWTAMPARSGDLLDLRKIEQGLENLQRLSTVQAEMEIVPTENQGESDIVIKRHQKKFWRVALSLDNSGSKSTGTYQGSATLYVDNPLALSDLAYVSWNNDVHGKSSQGTQNLTGHYSLPFGDTLFSFTGSRYNYHQTVAGLTTDYVYSGDNNSLNLQVAHMLHRAASHKTTVSYDINYRSTKNYIDDTEIEVQRRRTSAWKLGLQHKHYFENFTLNGGISYQRGTRWFGAKPAPEELFDEGTALAKIWRFDAGLSLPFKIQNDQFSFSLQHQQQIAVNRLTSQDQFSIGSRYSVRGFDGERTLSADNGWFTRGEFSWHAPTGSYQVYLATDYGVVTGPDTEFLLGTHLAGGALGIRGSRQNFGYDFYMGHPLSKPEGFITDDLMFAFNLNYEF